MSKYYKAEDVINAIAEQWHYEATIECPYAADDIEEWKQNARELYADLPTIEVSEDCISRAWMLNKLTEYERDYPLNELDDWQNTVVKWITTDIEDAPSVVPTTEQSSLVGEWKPFDRTWGREIWACSVCEEGVANMPTNADKPLYDYCPNCGAKMKGTDND